MATKPKSWKYGDIDEDGLIIFDPVDTSEHDEWRGEI